MLVEAVEVEDVERRAELGDEVGEGETADDGQVWYMPQLLEGMEGASSAS